MGDPRSSSSWSREGMPRAIGSALSGNDLKGGVHIRKEFEGALGFLACRLTSQGGRHTTTGVVAG
ncbi:conserved protein of unknown function [Ectopseudomonas oleovorans]|uniref:Uncharacterized protein n=1 Tax=Ectopseudomonas oleovorans TaxID=301 RepID=A0A653AY75_ECTOL|nr:conserved protein of unknown function [Pseudomonas oleovorans]